MFEVKNDIADRTIRIRVSGVIREADLREASEELRRITDRYNGSEHMLIADMRGLVPMSPECAALMGETIEYQRRRGVVLCAHLSDSSIIRLQAKRLAREAWSDDRMTIDVVSLEEAEKVLSEHRPTLARRR